MVPAYSFGTPEDRGIMVDMAGVKAAIDEDKESLKRTERRWRARRRALEQDQVVKNGELIAGYGNRLMAEFIQHAFTNAMHAPSYGFDRTGLGEPYANVVDLSRGLLTSRFLSVTVARASQEAENRSGPSPTGRNTSLHTPALLTLFMLGETAAAGDLLRAMAGMNPEAPFDLEETLLHLDLKDIVKKTKAKIGERLPGPADWVVILPVLPRQISESRPISGSHALWSAA